MNFWDRTVGVSRGQRASSASTASAVLSRGAAGGPRRTPRPRATAGSRRDAFVGQRRARCGRPLPSCRRACAAPASCASCAASAEVEGVRPHDDRAAAGRRLDQVLPAQRREAAAEQGHIGHAVVQRHLAQRVADPDVGRRRAARPTRCGAKRVKPCCAASAATSSKRCGWRGTTQPARGRRRRRARSGRACTSARNSRLLALARAGEHHHRLAARRRARRGPAPAAPASGAASNFRLPNTPLTVAPACASRCASAFGLRPHGGQRRIGRARQARQPPRLRQRLLAQARVGQHQRHAARPALRHQVGPDLGFHQHAALGWKWSRKRRTALGVSQGSQACGRRRAAAARLRPGRWRCRA